VNLQQIIAALPWLRRAWKFLPGPLRIPLLVIAAVVGLWRRGQDDEPADADTA
jgi:hypothetical protein